MSRLRRGARTESPIWPGFVDAMTSLLMVLMFVLTIFILVQSVLRDTITTKDTELDSLTAQVATLADALGLEKQNVANLQSQLGAAKDEGERQAALIATLSGQLSDAQGALTDAQARITSFEAQVASLLAERDKARGEASALTAQVSDLEAAKAKLLTDQEALNLALAKARDEIDANTEAARLAAAKADALNALIEDLKRQAAEKDSKIAATQTQLSDAEKARLAEAAAAEALREKLKNSDAELTAMTLALEEQRKKAEETLTLLAAAQAAKVDLDQQLTEAQKRAGLLAVAQQALDQEKSVSTENARRVALLNQQIAELTAQLGSLQSLLDAAKARDESSQVQLDSLGNQLNSALAQVAAEQKRRAELEEAERKRLEEEAKKLAGEAATAKNQAQELEKFRSEFFGELRDLLAGREGVRIVGDRFVFSSEVLFQPASADLSPEGRAQIAGVVQILDEIKDQIPPGIDWIIRVDGHTDDTPLSGTGQFKDNWELSQARALAVVRYMQDQLGFPPDRMAATGFGQYRPVASGDTPEARAQNRRIELKLTER